MADTWWCPQCGAEYVARITTCADCRVPLVAVQPTPAIPDAADDDDEDELEPVEFDLTEWPEEARSDLEWMLTGAGIAYVWPEVALLAVAGRDADAVQGYLDFLTAEPAVADPIETDEWRTAAIDDRGAREELSIDDFYEGDPAREDSDEFDFGREWLDADGVQCDVSWVQDTGELYLTRAPRWMPFMVEILAVIPTLEEVQRLLHGWENAMVQPGGVQWVRDRIARRAPEVPEEPEADIARS